MPARGEAPDAARRLPARPPVARGIAPRVRGLRVGRQRFIARAAAIRYSLQVTTDLLVILLFGACVGGWVLLAIVGAERQRMVERAEADRQRAPQAPQAPSRPAAAAKPPPAARQRTAEPSKGAAPAKRGLSPSSNAR